MAATATISITLPAEAVEAIEEHVSSGAFASPSDMILEALRLWQGEQPLKTGPRDKNAHREARHACEDIRAMRREGTTHAGIPVRDLIAERRR